MPLVDIAVPNYQHAKYLPDCLRGVLAQSMTDLRVVVIDNASTDGSAEIVKSFERTDSRVSLIQHERNLGRSTSYRRSVDWAESKYFMIVCSDDILEPGALERAVTIMERNEDIGFCYGEFRTIQGREAPVGYAPQCGLPWKVISGDAYIADRCRAPLQYNATFNLVRTAVQKRVGYYSPELAYTDDLEMVLKLARLGHVARCDAVQGYRREHSGNVSSAYWSDLLLWMKSVDAAFSMFFSGPGRGLANRVELELQMRRALAERAYWSSIARSICSDKDVARSMMHFAMEQSPRCRHIPPVAGLAKRAAFQRATSVAWEAIGRRFRHKSKRHVAEHPSPP